MLKQFKRARRKLLTRKDTTVEQKRSWKQVMAKAMRQYPTPSEKAIAPVLFRMGFEQQPLVIGFIPDFANFSKRVIVEIDGPIHRRRDRIAADAVRDAALKVAGWRVLRFTNQQVRNESLQIFEQVREIVGGTSTRWDF